LIILDDLCLLGGSNSHGVTPMQSRGPRLIRTRSIKREIVSRKHLSIKDIVSLPNA